MVAGEMADFQAICLNCLTVTALDRAKIPITLESDRAVTETSLKTLGSPAAIRARTGA